MGELPISIPARPKDVPEDFALALQRLHEDGHAMLSRVLRAAVDAGWTLQSLADALGVSRQAVEHRVSNPDRPVRRRWRLDEDTLRDLLTMQSVARTVNGAMSAEHPARRVSEEFSAWLARLVDEGWPVSALAKELGITAAAVTARLYRHGHRTRVPPSMAAVKYRNRRTGDPREVDGQ